VYAVHYPKSDVTISVVYKYGKALQQNVRSHISGVVLIKINFMLFYEIMRKK